jgi:hypothetical protein
MFASFILQWSGGITLESLRFPTTKRTRFLEHRQNPAFLSPDWG